MAVPATAILVFWVAIAFLLLVVGCAPFRHTS